ICSSGEAQSSSSEAQRSGSSQEKGSSGETQSSSGQEKSSSSEEESSRSEEESSRSSETQSRSSETQSEKSSSDQEEASQTQGGEEEIEEINKFSEQASATELLSLEDEKSSSEDFHVSDKDPVPISDFMGLLEQPLQDALPDTFECWLMESGGVFYVIPATEVDCSMKFEGFIDSQQSEPSWLLGMESNNEHTGIVYVVDSSEWFMGDKFNDMIKDSLNYQYILKLKNSNWGLACESYQEGEMFNKIDVVWREKVGLRPWLAGIIRDKKLVVLHVQILTQMLDGQL
ncbi:MAG: hypothetical protein ISP86_02980, partial [Shewanellaceae bacterium]|nr:hypothetical protein [Shewanellaceae bacterium]